MFGWKRWLAILTLGAACADEVEPHRNDCSRAGTDGATASCIQPTMPESYYVEQALFYFDTLDVSAPEENVPDYHPLVARWEWPPWFLLTAFEAEDMVDTARSLRRLDPSTVPERDCRFFPTQPFARCYIVFEYEEGPCPIYEEFTFAEDGTMTFVEAWSDLPELLPQDGTLDTWAEDPDYPRLANRIPGLGNSTGTIDLDGDAMREAGELDAEVADFATRARDWERAWARELLAADPDFFAHGCGWGE